MIARELAVAFAFSLLTIGAAIAGTAPEELRGSRHIAQRRKWVAFRSVADLGYRTAPTERAEIDPRLTFGRLGLKGCYRPEAVFRPCYSTTRSAVASRAVGIVSPSAFAVLRLIDSSNLET